MKNEDRWRPSKYVVHRGTLVASRDSQHISPSSRLVANLVARGYGANLRVHAKGRLLDLGCGAVPLYASYKESVREVICVDWVHTLHGQMHIDKEVDLTKPLPFADGEFDTIVLADVLEHVPTPDALWKEMARILAADGRILVNVPFLYWIHEDPHDYYRYTKFALRRFVEGAGLQLVLIEPVGGVLEVFADLFAKCVSQLPLIGRPAGSLAQSLTWWFARTKVGARISRKTGERFPLGYFLVAGRVSQPLLSSAE